MVENVLENKILQKASKSKNLRIKEIASRLLLTKSSLQNSHSDGYTERYTESHTDTPHSDSSW